MRLEFEIITPMRVQKIIFIGEVFQMEVADGLVRSFGLSKNILVHSQSTDGGTSF